jgi:hypothetical protein
MKKDKFQITMPELQKLIKEEYASMANKASRAEEIQARLKAINEEIKTLPGTLSEVEAGGLKGVKSTGWTGAGEEDKKYDEKFEKIGTHLKEDEEIEGEIEVGGEEMEGGPEMGMEAGPEMGYFELKFAELGKELDAKVGGESEEAEEVEMGDEMGAEMGDEENSMEGAMEGLAEEVVIAESDDNDSDDETEEVVAEGDDEDEDDMMNEDLEEPIEGKTPAQDSDARFNDYMEKDKHVKEGTQKVGTTLLSEGYSAERKSKMDAELERMKKLAKI